MRLGARGCETGDETELGSAIVGVRNRCFTIQPNPAVEPGKRRCCYRFHLLNVLRRGATTRKHSHVDLYKSHRNPAEILTS